MTRALYGIPYGATPENPDGTKMQIDVLSFAANQTEVMYSSPTGDDGSARFFYGWQTLFVDNSQNDYPVTVVFTGSLSVKKIPSRSQGYIPAACPKGQFSFRAQCANPAAINIPIELWATDIGPSIWAVDQGGSYTGRINIAGTKTIGTTVDYTIGTATIAALSFLEVKNTGTTNIYIALNSSVNTNGGGFMLKPGELTRMEGKPFPRITLCCVSDAAGGQVSFFGY